MELHVDAIGAALRAEPSDLSQSTAEHRKSFDAFAVLLGPGRRSRGRCDPRRSPASGAGASFRR